MTDNKPNELEAALGRLTDHASGKADLWERALEQVREEDDAARRPRFHIGSAFGGALVAAAVMIVVGVFVLPPRGGRAPVAAEDPSLGRQTEIASESRADLLLDGLGSPAMTLDSIESLPTVSNLMFDASEPNVEGAVTMDDSFAFDFSDDLAGLTESQAEFVAPELGDGAMARTAAAPPARAAETMRGAPRLEAAEAETLGAAPRLIIRSADISVESADFDGALIRLGELVRDRPEEYVESFEVTGLGEDRRATGVLRVLPERVEEVVRAIGELGAAPSATVSGRDVTRELAELEAEVDHAESVFREIGRRRIDLEREQAAREAFGLLMPRVDELQRAVELATVRISIRAPEGTPE